MRLNPDHPQNYNGFVHPGFLDHLKPHIKDMAVEIDGVDVPGSNAVEWAEKGMLESVSLFNAYTTYESMVIKGMGKELADFIRKCDASDQSLAFLHDYYNGSPEASMAALLEVMNHPMRLSHDIRVISSICIQDMDFTQSEMLEDMLLKNLNAVDRNQLKYDLSYHFQHYLRDPLDILDWQKNAVEDSDWIKLAIFYAHSGDFKAARRSLEKAERLANRDFYSWQLISQNYLFLLGDFNSFWDATRHQIEACEDTFTFLMTVEDLGSFVGDGEALEKARDLLNLAEIASEGADDLEQISYAWEQFFNDDERAAHCRKIAGIIGKSGRKQ